jgi:hypothetical protein
MYLDQYKIPGSINNDQNPCFGNPETYPNFQEDLEKFKKDITRMVDENQSKTFYKFGDGDYFFLRKESIGSASVGRRAISKQYSDISHEDFITGSRMNDYYTCEIYPENISMFKQVLPNKIDYPAEFGYGLVANKWFFKNFGGKIGLIGADKKIEIIEELMKYKEYREYLGLDGFNDYIKIPQKFACDNIEITEKIVGDQLEGSSSTIFLMGIGHVKSALTHRLKKYRNAVFFDVGSGIDAIAGIIDVDRPYFGDWTNYQIEGLPSYDEIDYLAYQGKGKHVYLPLNI